LIICFQAEDGIRSRHVTGVQTCALPIFTMPFFDVASLWSGFASNGIDIVDAIVPSTIALEVDRKFLLVISGGIFLFIFYRGIGRSEERRVGKEWRWRSTA